MLRRHARLNSTTMDHHTDGRGRSHTMAFGVPAHGVPLGLARVDLFIFRTAPDFLANTLEAVLGGSSVALEPGHMCSIQRGRCQESQARQMT